MMWEDRRITVTWQAKMPKGFVRTLTEAVGDSLEKTDSSGNPDSGGGLELLSDEGGN